jgi:hypothetical protein
MDKQTESRQRRLTADIVKYKLYYNSPFQEPGVHEMLKK